MCLQVGSHTPHFNKMEGNTICRQIDWDHDEERLAAWAEVGRGKGRDWDVGVRIGRREESAGSCYHLSCMCTGPHRLPLD